MDIIQSRANAKKNKNAILYSGMLNYGKYGKVNPYNYVLSEDELQKVDVEKLVALIKSLSSYKHRIFYYGQRDANSALATVTSLHNAKPGLKDYPVAKKYPELPLTENKVYVCYYPMKQAEIVMLGKDVQFNKDFLTSFKQTYDAVLTANTAMPDDASVH